MTSDAPRRDPPTTSLRVAQVLAFVALLAALIGAMGPAERVRTSYSWPPETLPAEQPERLWYAPLLLVTHRPEGLSVRVPCALPPALPGAGARATVLATARDPNQEANVLRVTLRNIVLPGAAVAVTAPVPYEARNLVPLLKGGGGRALVLPNVLTYFPCLRSPRLGDGIVDVPTHVVTSRDGAWILGPSETSPFLGVLDLYRLQRLPVVSEDYVDDEGDNQLAVLVVDRRIPGAAVAEPVRTTLVS